MSQVTADGLPEDGCLGLIPTHPCLQPIHLQPQKGSQGQKQMTQNCALAPAPPHSIASALDDRLQSSIPFSPTPLASPPSSSGHWSPSILRPRFGKPSEIPGQAQSPSDAPPAPPVGFPPPEFPCRSGFTRRLLFSRVRKNQPKEAMSFRFFKDAYQLSISTYSGLKPRSRAFRSIS